VHHYLITKDTPAKGKPIATTSIAELEPDRRREEIARMLAAAEITVEVRVAAERLMRAAAGGCVKMGNTGVTG
jgi:DNA repair protein RecN (Recombination protein N)